MMVADVIFATLELLLALPIVVGNALVIVAIRRTARLQTNTNQFVISLSLADLSLGVGLPFHACWYLVDALRSSKVVCLLRLSLAMTSCGASILNLLLISVDRYMAVLRPLRYVALVTHGRVVALIVLTWCYALFLGVCIFLTERWSAVGGCALIYSVSHTFLLLAGSVQYSLILAAMFVLYARILLVAYRHAARIHQMQVAPAVVAGTSSPKEGTSSTNSDATRGGASSGTGSSAATPRGGVSLKELRSTKTLSLVMGAFTLCWAPYFCACVLATFDVRIPKMAAQVTLLLGLFNSTLNPVIYAWKSHDFRSAFRRLLGCDVTSEVSETSGTLSTSGTL